MFSRIIRSDIFKSIGSGYGLFVTSNVISLLLTPFILKYVSRADYGVYLICVDFLAWMGLLQLGTSKVLESEAGRLIGSKKFKEINVSYNTAFLFQIIMSILVIPFYYFLVRFGIKQEQYSDSLLVIIVLFSFSAAIEQLRQIYSSLLIASKKIYIDNLIQIGMYLLHTILVLLFTPKYGVIILAISNLIIVVFNLFKANIRVRKLYQELKTNLRFFSMMKLKFYLKNGMYFTLASIAGLLIVKFDSYFLGSNVGLEQVTSFYLSVKLFTLTEKLITILINNFRPHIAHLYGRKEIVVMNQFYQFASHMSVLFAMLFVGATMLVNRYFISIWVGSDYYIGERFTYLFGIFIIANLSSLSSRIILSSTLYKLKYHSLSRVFEGFFRVIIILLLFNIAGMEILPMSSLITSLLFGYVALALLVKQFFQDHALKSKSISLFLFPIFVLVVVMLCYSFATFLVPYLIFVIGLIGVFYMYILHKQELKSLAKLFLK